MAEIEIIKVFKDKSPEYTALVNVSGEKFILKRNVQNIIDTQIYAMNFYKKHNIMTRSNQIYC